MQPFSADEIEAAQRIVYAAMPPTPQYAWPLLRERLGAEVWVKHENHTPLGAFKLRGGLVYLQGLAQREPGCRGVISATRGNHGQSIALRRARGTAWAPPSSCRTATRWRRTPRCARWAPS